jgi:hypothetical protein
MISRDALAKACSINDCLGTQDLEGLIESLDIDLDALAYVGQQRALRMVAQMMGKDAAKDRIDAPPEVLAAFATMFLDGAAAMARAKDGELDIEIGDSEPLTDHGPDTRWL